VNIGALVASACCRVLGYLLWFTAGLMLVLLLAQTLRAEEGIRVLALLGGTAVFTVGGFACRWLAGIFGRMAAR
jgi:hypothetical protein